MDAEDLFFRGESEDSSTSTSRGPSPSALLDFGLFSRTDTLEDSDGSAGSRSGTHTHSPGSDRSLFDSDVGTGSDNDAQLKTATMADGPDV